MKPDILFRDDTVDIHTRIFNALANSRQLGYINWNKASLYFDVSKDVFRQAYWEGWHSTPDTLYLRQKFLIFLQESGKKVDLRVWL